jgi:hypothetical protein
VADKQTKHDLHAALRGADAAYSRRVQAERDPTAPTIGSLVCGSDRKPGKGTEMSAPRNILRIVLLTAAAGLLAVAASVLREKKATVDLTTQQIEDAISALDPGVRAAVIGRLTADAVQQVKDHVDR